MARIGIFGGTFNPVHLGHVRLAQHYCRQLALDRLLVIPTQQPPHKTAPDLLPVETRLQLCRLAFAGEERVSVSDIEARRPGKSFTCDTVAELRRQWPDAQLFLLVGSDMFLGFRRWKNWEYLLENTTLCTAARHPGELGALQKAAAELSGEGRNPPMVFDFPVLVVSSTQIRQMLAAGEDCSQLLPPAVYDQLKRHPLFGQTGRLTPSKT